MLNFLLQYTSTLSYILLFFAIKKHFYQPCSAQPQKATSPATPVESISPEELLFHECFPMVRHPQTFLIAFILEPSVHRWFFAMPLLSFSGDWKNSTECYAHGNIIATWQEENVFHAAGVTPF